MNVKETILVIYKKFVTHFTLIMLLQKCRNLTYTKENPKTSKQNLRNESGKRFPLAIPEASYAPIYVLIPQMCDMQWTAVMPQPPFT